MVSLGFTYCFLAFLLCSVSIRFWLANRHIRHVRRHRNAVPPQFAHQLSLEAHQKAADYTVTRVQLGIVSLLVDHAVLLVMTIFGGLQWLSANLGDYLGHGMRFQIGLIAAFSILTSLIDLPFDLYRQFVIEERFGFNRMTWKLYLIDTLKSSAIGVAIGLPLLWLVLYLMGATGAYWWLYAWVVLALFQIGMQWIYPSVIAPLFNTFTPLNDESLRARIEGLMQRVEFSSNGLFVMDGSRRSGHGNAYFTGFGARRRVVFYDTLIEKLNPPEVEAVLAHELGHFKLRHIKNRMVVALGISLIFLALLGFLKTQAWFYTGLGVLPLLNGSNDALALLLFMLTMPVFTFALGPIAAWFSRKHEFEADAFAAKHSNQHDLISGLVKMYEDNASTVTPDPLYSAYHDSHPPASIRIAHLLAQ